MPMQDTIKRNASYGFLVCLIAGLYYAYEFLLRILPGALQTELVALWGGVSASVFGQIASLYYLAYSPLQLPVGMLMDRYGPRVILSVACLFCALGSWLFAASHPLWVVGLGRFLVGAGSAFAFVGILSLGHQWLPRQYFSLLAGLVTTFAMLTVMFGMLNLTLLGQYVGVRSILLCLAVTGVILAMFIYGVVRDAPTESQPLHSQPWQLFLKEVLLVLLDKRVWVIGIIGALMYTALSVFAELWGKVYLEQAHHLTSLQAAQAVSTVFLGWAVGAPLLGYASDRTGYRFLPLGLLSFLAMICIAMVLYVPHLSFSSINILLFVYGLATASEIIVFVIGKEQCQASLSGTVFSTVNMIVMLVGAVFQPTVGFLLDWSAKTHGSLIPHVYTVQDYRLALSVLPASLLLVIFLLFYFQNHQVACGKIAKARKIE